MISLSLLASLGWMAGGAGATLSAQERPPAVLFVVAARKSKELPASALFFDAADKAFRAQSGLSIESPERLGIDPAPLSTCAPELMLSCWLSRALDTSRPPRFVVGLTLLQLDEGRLRVSATLLDVKEGARARAAVEHEGDASVLEDELAKTTWSRAAEEVDTRQPRALFELLGRTAVETGAWLDARGVKRSARVAIEQDPGVATLSLDGAVVGSLDGSGAVVDLRPGKRALRLESPSGVLEREIELLPGVTSSVSFHRAPERHAGPLRWGYRFGGPALVVGGGVLLGVAVAIAGGASAACLGRPGSTGDCPTLGNATTGFDSGRGPSNDPSVINPAGLDLVALGVGLASAGAVLAVFGWLGPEDEEPAWWTGVLAVLAGGGLYATTALLGRP